MAKYWVVDIHREQRFGPFSTKKHALKIRTQVRRIPDLGLEYASNVYVLSEEQATEWGDMNESMMKFPVGNYCNVVAQNARTFGSE